MVELVSVGLDEEKGDKKGENIIGGGAGSNSNI
jgi:hypothetical protein